MTATPSAGGCFLPLISDSSGSVDICSFQGVLVAFITPVALYDVLKEKTLFLSF